MREVVSFNGSPGTGKSTVLRERLARHVRVVALDPAPDKADAWKRAGFRRVKDLPEMSRAIARNFFGSWRYVWTPPAAQCGEALHELSKLLYAYQERVHRPKPMALAVDEMAECYSEAQAKTSALWGFRQLLLQGRHLEVSIYGATQFPQDVAVRFRAAADQAYMFEVYEDRARAAVLDKIGRKFAPEYLSLQPFEYLLYERGKVTKGRTRKGG